MKIKKKNYYSYNYLIIFFLFYLTVIFGYYLNEDNLGGAMHDAVHHFKISEKFNENFYYTLSNFGNHAEGLGTRNSPIFWIFLSFLIKFFSYETLRLINTFVIFIIAIIFYKCLLLKFKKIDPTSLIFLSSFIFLSPSLRSLGIWPYSLLWGLLFFIISIYFYLKFIDNLNLNKSGLILINIITAAYIYPSFAVFYLFYFFELTKKLKNKGYLLILLFLSFILSIPCLLYLSTNDFLSSFEKAQGVGVSLGESFNISNKILIISTILVYLLMPIINLKELYLKVKKLNLIPIFFLLLFCLINFYYFNFPYSTWGGGFFHKISNFLFENNFLFFISAFLSILIIFLLIEKNFKNYFLLTILILFNPQFTIYIKYFDPLIFILFLTLFDFDLKKHFIDKSYALYQFYGVIIFYYLAIYFKKILI